MCSNNIRILNTLCKHSVWTSFIELISQDGYHLPAGGGHHAPDGYDGDDPKHCQHLLLR